MPSSYVTARTTTQVFFPGAGPPLVPRVADEGMPATKRQVGLYRSVLRKAGLDLLDNACRQQLAPLLPAARLLVHHQRDAWRNLPRGAQLLILDVLDPQEAP